MKKNRNGDKKAKNKILKIAGQSLGIMSIGLMLNGIVSPSSCIRSIVPRD